VYKHEHKHSGLHESTVVGLFCFWPLGIVDAVVSSAFVQFV